ncbi:DctP family TRAP transporter solute-binding subunit [Phytoactinopolyspora alkaliphila]|uniref:DctP family TRAP transporter solute-binding subunit n=1 Tax=Phytoactinopolyspora alkaliphila TaxID=1783498 RepID=A0A6N9YNH9_9ACTN|nr:DctP family TRAP transporter solute-binding subunit [Phytoactinopolyspora alkaliphila]NED96522.1 DctP family TRAP transporter solute-binding subunit [Phytoactinopolyspora alkaliphila]
MTKRFLSNTAAGVALTLSAVLAGCGGSNDDTEGGGEVSLRFSTILAPDDIATGAINRFAELVEENTSGAVEIQVFSSGSLYDQNAEQSALLRGDLDMTFAGPQWVADRVPAAEIVSTPYVISDAEHLYRVMDGPPGEQLFELVREEMGIRPLTTLYIGTRQLSLRDGSREVRTPADLDGVKLRVPDRDNWLYMGRALGAEPTPVAFGEVYLALQTGTIDAQETPLPLTYASKLHEVTEQVVLSSHVADSVWPTINEDVWQGLDPGHQDAIVDAWRTARDEATAETLALESDLARQFEEAGLRVYEPDVDAFREHVLGTYLQDESITERWLPDMYDQIESLR